MKKISKKNKPTRRQHHVPQVYLNNFSNSDGCIAVMDKCERQTFTTGVRAVGAENNFYTLEKLNNPYFWEHTYASIIEPLMGKLLSRLISQTNILVQNGATVISPSEKAQLAVIMVMQLLRGKQSRQYMQKLYADYLPAAIEKAKNSFGPFSNEQNKQVEAFVSDEYYFKQTAMEVTLDSDRIAKYAGVLFSRVFLIYRIQGNMEFITSDNPVMFINSITKNARPFANGLININTLLYYPISPKLLLLAVHPLTLFGTLINKDCQLIDLDPCKEFDFITTINQKQISQCYQHVFARSVETLNDLKNLYLTNETFVPNLYT